MSKRLRLFSMLLLSIGFAPAFGPPALAQKPQILSATEAHRKAEAGEVLLVDIRTPEEWRETGVATSAHTITMHQNGQAFLKELLAAASGDPNRPIALICRTGNRSSQLQSALQRAGFTNIIDVSEGMAGSQAGRGWLKLGLPVRKGASIASGPKVSMPSSTGASAAGR